jgi:hypothetical protein
MARSLSALHHLPTSGRITAKSRTDAQLAARIGLVDVERSRDARHRLRVLISTQKVAACFDHRTDGGLPALH